MRWITRENVRVDRVASPWLIKRFVDPEVEFRFVPEAELLRAAQKEQATPFDATRFPKSCGITEAIAAHSRRFSKTSN